MSLFPAAFSSPELPGMDMSIVIPAPAKPNLKPPKLPRNPIPRQYLAGGDQASTPKSLKIQSLLSSKM
uniref:Uncharacterized protein n=1 Tax=Zea mays TaxID=4577 RepID=C4IZC5_MAIZE|nr:unknown [Zea mays]ACR35108.1 unknown [Zea mays]